MPNDDTVGKGGWGGENVSKSDGAILECSLRAFDRPVWSPVLQWTKDDCLLSIEINDGKLEKLLLSSGLSTAGEILII